MVDRKNKRLAQTRLSDGTVVEREWTPHEKYMLFAKGFRAGAGVRAIDPRCAGIGAYDRGYEEGMEARRRAVSAYAEEIGYVPSILRSQEPTSTLVEDPGYSRNTLSELIVGPTPGKPCPDCSLPLGMGCDCVTRKD